jgi:cytochrome c peroxidase
MLGEAIYAGEYFSDSLAVLEPGAEARSVALGMKGTQSVERRGEMLFYDAQYCLQKWLSCSSCHPGDGRPDGLNWDLMLDDVGNAKNTKSLLLSHRTPPTTATGARPNAEASVRNGYRNIEYADRPDEDASAIDAFLKAQRPEPSPHLVNGALSAAAVRGKKVFEGTGCGSCHSGPLYTGLGQHRVGSGRGREKDTSFDTPTLIEVWRSGPYFHDGRAATLQNLFGAPDNGPTHSLKSKLSKQQLEDLIAFVLSL